jgi:hypothetical protein
MEQARQRIEEIKQQQRKRMRGGNPPTSGFGDIHDRQKYLIALGGIAAGLMIAAVIWLTQPLLTEDNHESNQQDAAEAVSSDEIRKANENIARLNHHMEMLSETISSMDAKFKRILLMAESMNDVANKNAFTLQELSTDAAAETVEFAEDNSGKPGMDNIAHDAQQEFSPTHYVNARINLRPSMSLDTTPIAVLDIGAEVEYISETGGWYYVNTRSHGKGWCSSEYLSSLQDSRQDASQD